MDTALVFLASFFILSALTYGTPMSFDGNVMYAMARGITHGRLHLVLGEPPFIVRRTGAFAVQFPYPHYGIAITLVILPLYVLARSLHFSPAHTDLLVLLTSPLIIAAAAAVTFRLGLALKWSRRLAAGVALAFALLTMMAQDSTELFSEPGVAIGIGLVLLALLRWREGRRASGLLAGTGIGIAILFRDDSAILVAPAVVAALFLVERRELLIRLKQEAVGFVLPLIPVLGWTLYYSHVSSHSWIPHTYGGTFNSPFWRGFYGQLIGPNKGFLFYNPWLLLAIPGVWLLGRREPVFTTVLAGLFLVRILFYAKWNFWYGGVTWGPRFVVPAILPMCLLAGESLRALPRITSSVRLALGALATGLLLMWSALITVVSVWVSYVTDLKLAMPALPAHPTAAERYQAWLTQWHNHLFVATQSSWWIALRHLGDPPDLHYFHTSPSALGLALLAAGGACSIGLMRRSPGDGNGEPTPSNATSAVDLTSSAPALT